MIKKLLLKISHLIIRKYAVVPLDLKDKVLYHGKIFEVQEIILHKEFFKTDLELKLCDCFKWEE